MSNVYHQGELAVQEQAGGLHMAEMVGRGIRPLLVDYVIRALPEQTFFIMSFTTANGNVWALPVVGQPGFATATNAHTLHLAFSPPANDSLWQQVTPGTAVGLLGIVLHNRIRVRINGVIDAVTPTALIITVSQSYGNCPKYIQTRRVTDTHPSDPQYSEAFTTLATTYQTWITTADTFFIASGHAQAGMDASHRGGKPGFVQLEGNDRLLWPDYAGNMMFNTLGNITANPHTGLLFIDFAADRVLQLTGHAEVLYNDPRLANFAGAQRLVAFQLTHGREVQNGLGLHWEFLDPSPFNP